MEEITEHLAENAVADGEGDRRARLEGRHRRQRDAVKDVLEGNRDLYECRTGDAAKEVGRHARTRPSGA